MRSRVRVGRLREDQALHLLKQEGVCMGAEAGGLLGVMVDRKLDLSKLRILSGKYHRREEKQGI